MDITAHFVQILSSSLEVTFSRTVVGSTSAVWHGQSSVQNCCIVCCRNASKNDTNHVL